MAFGISNLGRIAIHGGIIFSSGGIAPGVGGLGQVAVGVIAVLAGYFLLTAILGVVEPDFFFGQQALAGAFAVRFRAVIVKPLLVDGIAVGIS